MAECPTSDSAAEQALKKLADRLTCGVCLESYTDPKLLQCFHVFCKKCLEQVAAQGQQGQPLVCPTCQGMTQIPPNGLSGLQGAFLIHHLFEIQDALTKIKAPQQTICEKCKKQNATSYCRDCGQFICEFCTVVHETWEELSSHEVISLDQLEGDVTKLVPPKKTTLYCSKHKERELELYCETCGELICHNCTVRLHKGHQYDLVSDTFEKHKSELVSHLQVVKQHLDTMTVNQAIKGLDIRCHQITDQRMATEATIHKTIQQLHEALEVRKTELISQLDRITQQKLKNLAAQRNQFKLVQTQLSSCLNFISESLQTGSEGEILAMKKPVVRQIEEVTAEFRPDTLVPRELADIRFTSSAEVSVACQQFGKVSASPVSPEKCYATGKGLQVATVGEETTATLHMVDQEGQEYDKLIPHVSYELKSCSDATTVKGSVKRMDKSKYEIRYKPTTRGRHQLHVRVKGEHIKESPYTMVALRKLGTLIRTIGGLRGPWGVAVNENGQIIVAEGHGHCISIFGEDGEKIKTFGTHGSGHGQFSHPHGVAIDEDGNILVVDCDNCRVQKFTADGQFLTSVGTRGSGCLQFRRPGGIGISKRNRIYVCDRSNRRVQILNADLTFHSSFSSQGHAYSQFYNPWDVAFDSSCNVYVADCGNDCIQVFTEDGYFLRRFGKRGGGDGELNSPQSVTIDSDDIVYVCEENNYRVSLFTSEGWFLRSFGTRGKEPGQFEYPCEITVDTNGHVYVSDSKNNRLQIL